MSFFDKFRKRKKQATETSKAAETATPEAVIPAAEATPIEQPVANPEEHPSQSENAASEVTQQAPNTQAGDTDVADQIAQTQEELEATALQAEAILNTNEAVAEPPAATDLPKQISANDQPNHSKKDELPAVSESAELSANQPEIAEPAPPQKRGLFARLKSGLSKTRTQLGKGLSNLVLGQKKIDDDLLEEIEEQLLIADIGVEATQSIIKDLTERLARKELTDGDKVMAALKSNLAQLLEPVSAPLVLPKSTPQEPFVILVVGVNGAGKTTTIGKLAKRFQNQGKKVLLAAGDTFRAAAIEQLQVWGERNQIPVIAQHSGADSASVIFDAYNAAKSRGCDILIADTAGRLHTQSNLMQELAKVKRVLGKACPTAPHEVLLVLDSGTGQNAINQAVQFHEAVDVTGIALTKLDGTAKGGVIFAIADKMKLPIRYIGVGEQIDDLRDFEHQDFIEALFE